MFVLKNQKYKMVKLHNTVLISSPDGTDIFTFSKVPSSIESVNSSFAFLVSGYHICHELSRHWISLSILIHVFQIRIQSSVECWRCFQSTARLIANFLYLTMFLHDIVYITPLSINTSSRISQFELFKTTWVWFLPFAKSYLCIYNRNFHQHTSVSSPTITCTMSSENSTDYGLNDKFIVLQEELPGVTRWIKNCILYGKLFGSGYNW